MMPTATILLNVFRDIGEMREVGERAHDIERFLDTQVSERGVEQSMRRTLAMEAHRLLTNRFHLLKRRVATLRTNHVAKQSTEQACVCFERRVFVVDRGNLIVHRRIMLHCGTTAEYVFARFCCDENHINLPPKAFIHRG